MMDMTIVIVFNIFNLIEPYEAKISEGLFKTVQYTKVSIPIKKKYWPMGRAKQRQPRPPHTINEYFTLIKLGLLCFREKIRPSTFYILTFLPLI